MVSSHPSILISLLNIAGFKMLDEDTAYYPSNLIQEYKPRILWNFHFQSGKILLLFSYLLAFKNNLPGKKKFHKAMIVWTVLISLCKKLVSKRITFLENYLEIWTITSINITEKKDLAKLYAHSQQMAL